MRVLRATLYFTGIVGCLLFSGLGLYTVNANGNVEAVVDGYPVIAGKSASVEIANN
jgi:hypothetical protein